MSYEIHYKNDLLAGASLVARIPEEVLDKKALYTINADRPDFLLPFRYRNIDGHVEFVYQIGTHNKLQYISGNRAPKEYAGLWVSILKPLLTCGDWFMDPCAFVLNAEYLYFNKAKGTVSYIYIPSAEGCSGYGALKEMAAEVSKLISVSDAALENKVLRAIMKDFNPNEFLQMLKAYTESQEPVQQEAPVIEENNAYVNVQVLTSETDDPCRTDIHEPEILAGGNKKNRSGFFGKKKETGQEEIRDIFDRKELQPEPQVNIQSFPLLNDVNVATEKVSSEIIGTGLRYAGRSSLPRFIPVEIAAGEIFTIGRFDSDIGKQQSSFEFDKKTKAVSRRHAVIERDGTGYKIIDISSSAGTFVNEQKLPPNTPYSLQRGFRVSFGNSGADYVWEAG